MSSPGSVFERGAPLEAPGSTGRAEREGRVVAALRDGVERVRRLSRGRPAGPGRPVGSVAVPWHSRLDALDLFRAIGDEAPAVLWVEPRGRAERCWSYAGVGGTVLCASGAARLVELQRAAAQIFDGLVVVQPEWAPPPALVGGFAFRAGDAGLEWDELGDAAFVLPRWTFARAGDRALVRVLLSDDDLERPDDVAREARAWAARLAPPAEGAPAGPVTAVREVDRPAWADLVEAALGAIRAGELEKVVTATRCEVRARAAVDVPGVLARLSTRYPDCVRFAVRLGEATFLGASPERLVGQRGLAVQVDALAGSASRGVTADGDEAARRRLVTSDKDRREHDVVVRAVAEELSRLGVALDIPSEPIVRSLANLHHLWTPVRGQRSAPGHVLDLVERIHPTPAVCGAPRDAALAWIARHEPEGRGWYSGGVGWFDRAGDGDFAVALRCGLVRGATAVLHAGTGIVEGSDAAAEHTEVLAKLAPMLGALEAAP